MDSADVYTLDAIVMLLCPYCSSPRLHKQNYFSKEDNLTEYGLYTSLAALCLTSRHTNAIATPHLYHQPSTTRWGPLLRTLIARPDLGRCVRYLPTREWVPAGVGEQCVPPEVRTYWVQQYPRHPSNGGVVRLPGNSLAPLTALLCPALRELGATVDEREAVPGVKVLPEQAVVLDTLRTVVVSCPVDTEGLRLPGLANLFSLAPNLERFVALVAGNFLLVPQTLPGVDGLLCSMPPVKGHQLVDFDRGARMLRAWVHMNMTKPDLWDTVVFLMPEQSGLRLDRKGAVPFYDLVDDPWCVRGLAGRRELSTFSLDSRCLVPHANPQMRTGFPPSLSGEPRVNEKVLVDLLPPSARELRIVLSSVGPEAEDLGRPLSRLADASPERFNLLKKVEVSGDGADVLEPCMARFRGLDVEFLLSTGSDFAFHGYMGEKLY